MSLEENAANAGYLAEAYEIPGSSGNVQPFLIVRIRLGKTPGPLIVERYNNFLEAYHKLEDVVIIAKHFDG